MKCVRFSVCVWYTSLWRSVLLSVAPRAVFTRQRERKLEEIDAIESAKLCPLDMRETKSQEHDQESMRIVKLAPGLCSDSLITVFRPRGEKTLRCFADL